MTDSDPCITTGGSFPAFRLRPLVDVDTRRVLSVSGCCCEGVMVGEGTGFCRGNSRRGVLPLLLSGCNTVIGTDITSEREREKYDQR